MNKKNKIKQKHPSLDIVSTHGTEFSGKKIVLCVAGSVAVYKSIELARFLMRHGADVSCVLSGATTRLVKPDYFRWATGNKVVTKLTGDLEHIQLADYRQSDLIIVYPCTANMLGKLANGIDDTPVSTVLTVGLGSKIPIVIGLAMHQSMYENAAVLRNIEFLRKKVDFISSNMIEGKAKAAEPEEILEYVLRKFGFSSKLRNSQVLITAGPTIEYIDPVRVITNKSTGKTGLSLAAEFVAAGAKVTLIYGPGRELPPKVAKIIHIETVKEMLNAVKKEMKKKFDIVILSAAASDYIPKNSRTKIKSTKRQLTIKLQKAPKIIDQVKKIQKDVFLVGFKAETHISKQNLIHLARKKLKESNANMIVANDIGSEKYKKNTDFNSVIIVDSRKTVQSGWKNKILISKFIRNEIEKRIKE